MSPYTIRPIHDDVDTALSAYSPLIRRLLAERGVLTAEDAEHFLNPDLGT